MRSLPFLGIALLALAACSPPVTRDGLTCGEGTTETGGQCVANPGLTCGEGTAENAGKCVASGGLTCGAGTRESGGQCLPTGAAGLVCGRGTAESEGKCIGTTVCGTGTSLVDDECRAASTACGAGASWDGSQCVGAGGGITCGRGTVLQGSTCVADAAPTTTCGAGTSLAGTECQVAAAACGAGTVLQGHQCVPAGTTPTSLATFVADTTHRAMLDGRAGSTTSLRDFDFAYTDASEVQTRAFIDSDAAIIGNASMLFIGTGDLVNTANLSRQYSMAIESRASCDGSDFSTYPSGSSTYVSFGHWANGVVASAICATAGSVIFQSTGNTREVKITLNAMFDDGTTITDRSWIVTYAP